jgi:hypothetical protein
MRNVARHAVLRDVLPARLEHELDGAAVIVLEAEFVVHAHHPRVGVFPERAAHVDVVQRGRERVAVTIGVFVQRVDIRPGAIRQAATRRPRQAELAGHGLLVVHPLPARAVGKGVADVVDHRAGRAVAAACVGEVATEFEARTQLLVEIEIGVVAFAIAVGTQAAMVQRSLVEAARQWEAIAGVASAGHEHAAVAIPPRIAAVDAMEIAAAVFDMGGGGFSQFGLARDDVDDRCHRAVAIHGRTGAGGELDACDVLAGDEGRIELTVEGVAERHAIQQQFDVSRTETTHVDARTAVAAGAHVHARQQREGLVEGARTVDFNVPRIELVNRADLLDRRLACTDHHLVEGLGIAAQGRAREQREDHEQRRAACRAGDE